MWVIERERGDWTSDTVQRECSRSHFNRWTRRGFMQIVLPTFRLIAHRTDVHLWKNLRRGLTVLPSVWRADLEGLIKQDWVSVQEISLETWFDGKECRRSCCRAFGMSVNVYKGDGRVQMEQKCPIYEVSEVKKDITVFKCTVKAG